MANTPATPQPIAEAGLSLEFRDGGTRLVVRDAEPDACTIRNRGGEALANLLKANRQIRALDVGQSGISDNGVGHICLALRQTDQLEELTVSTVGTAGLEFLLGVVRRCGRLRALSISVVDRETLVAASQNVKADDYNTSTHVKQKKEGDEEDEAEEEEKEEPPEGVEPEDWERQKLDKLRAILNENDYNSEDEDVSPVEEAGAKGNAPKTASVRKIRGRPSKQSVDSTKSKLAPSVYFLQLLGEFAEAVCDKENLLEVNCLGDIVPDDISHDINQSVQEHNAERQRKLAARQERGAKTALDALKAQFDELRAPCEGGIAGTAAALRLPGECDGEVGSTRLGIRSFVGRRLFSAMGEALFECQRFKSKENEAVSTWQGECAFLAMYLRKLAKEENERLKEKAK